MRIRECRIAREGTGRTLAVRKMLGSLRGWLRTREARRLLTLLALALLIRLALAPWFSFFGDQPAYIYWGSSLRAHFFDLYSALSRNPNLRLSPQYPPFAMYIFGGSVAFYHGLAAVFGLPAVSYAHPSRELVTVMKLPAIACDLGVTATIYLLARKRLGQKWALIAAASYAFSPAALIDGAMWGQTDGVVMLPLLLALICAQRGRAVWAGCLLALAVLFKPQSAVFAPLLLVYLWRWSGRSEALRAVAAAGATGLALCLPYLLPPHFDLLVYPRVLARSLNYYPAASPSAFNLWVVLLIPNRLAQSPYLGPLSPYLIGYALFGCCLALALFQVWRDASPARFYFCAGFLALAFFDVTTLQLERYLFPTLALFLMASLYDRRGVKPYIFCSVVCFLNMWARILIYNSMRLRLGPLDSAAWGDLVRPWYGTLALSVSLLDVGMLLWLARRLLLWNDEKPRAIAGAVPARPDPLPAEALRG